MTLHLPIEVADYVDFYASEHHATQRRADLPPDDAALHAELEAPAHRLPRPRRHRRGVGHRRRPTRAGSARRRPTRRRSSARASASTSRPSWASSWAVPPRSAPGCRVDEARRPPLRRRPAQRLERPRHPGLGVRPARTVPRQVLRDLHLRLGRADRRPGRGPGRPARARTRAAALPAGRRPAFGLDVHVEVRAQRHGRARPEYRDDVLVAGPDARAPDRQRRLACATATSSRRDDLRRRARDPRQPARAVVERHRAAHPRDGSTRGFLEDGDAVTITRLGARPGRHRIGLGEVTGRSFRPWARRAMGWRGRVDAPCPEARVGAAVRPGACPPTFVLAMRSCSACLRSLTRGSSESASCSSETKVLTMGRLENRLPPMGIRVRVGQSAARGGPASLATAPAAPVPSCRGSRRCVW